MTLAGSGIRGGGDAPYEHAREDVRTDFLRALSHPDRCCLPARTNVMTAILAGGIAGESPKRLGKWNGEQGIRDARIGRDDDHHDDGKSDSVKAHL